MRLAFASDSFIAGWNGDTVYVKKNDAWPAEHPFVLAHRGSFADLPNPVHGAADIEQATAAPGERRNVRRSA